MSREAPEIFLSCSSTFLAVQIQLVVFVSAFVMVRTVWSFFLFCDLLLMVYTVPSNL